MSPSLINIFFLPLLLLLQAQSSVCLNVSDIPAIIIFGDSLYDNGNNNGLPGPSIARANHNPYGIDFDTRTPTGRFANGRIAPDILAAKIGLRFALAYLDPSAKGSNLTQGINLASGGAGILDSTSAMLTPYNLTQQLIWFDDYIQRLRAFEGVTAATRRINKALCLISVGSNDISYKNLNSEVAAMSNAQFITYVLDNYVGRIRAIYNRGCRRFLISAIGPLGCTPIQITLNCAMTNPFGPCNRNICNENTNALALDFNNQLQTRLRTLNTTLSGVTIYYSLDSYYVTYDAVKNPAKYGFQVGNLGCCGSGTLEIGDYCVYVGCFNRTAYIFWDAIHPSTAFTDLLTTGFFNVLASS